MKNIIINFSNIVSELESKGLALCSRKTSVGLFLLDKQNDLYVIENYYAGSYLDKLIRNKTKVEFRHVDNSIRYNISESEFEIRDCKWVDDFIKQQSVYW